jgi:hypothetical protein
LYENLLARNEAEAKQRQRERDMRMGGLLVCGAAAVVFWLLKLW